MAKLFKFLALDRSHVLPLLFAILWANTFVSLVASEVTQYLPQGFFFDWNTQGEAVPIPTTAQCDQIHISWQRGTAQGPNPTAPYYLQVYTSTFIVPFVIPAGDGLTFDWTVPFIPGTQYQICMFDKNGVSGGCQGTYTVYQRPNTTIDNPPTCFNLTYPQSTLGVDAQVPSGALSQYGWVDQCTDISVKPTNGTPPYTLTVAPALHPPYNITSNNMDAINWTTSLSWGMPFFISLVDSTGLSWANGPLHSGGGGSTECLSLSDATSSKKTISPGVAIGSGIGGLVLGLVCGLLGALLFFSWKRRSRMPDAMHKESSNMSLASAPEDAHHYRDLPSVGSDNSRDRLMHGGYHIEPFILPAEQEFGVRTPPTDSSSTAIAPSGSQTNPQSTSESSQSQSTRPTHHSSRSTSVAVSTIPLPPSSPNSVGGQQSLSSPIATSHPHVYVVHHDGGRAPVTVYTDDGAEVVELPPRYPDSRLNNSPRSANQMPSSLLRENRQPGAIPQK